MRPFLLAACLCVFPIAAAATDAPACVGLADAEDPPAIAELREQAQAAEDASHYDEAITVNERILALAPRDIVAINTIAGLHGMSGRFEEELTWTQRALAIDPCYGRAWINTGSALASLGRTEDAEAAFRKASTLPGTEAFGHYSLGVMDEERGDMSAAEAHYRDAIAADPTMATAHFNLAAALANQGRFAEAKAELARVLELDPGFDDARQMSRQIEAEPGLP